MGKRKEFSKRHDMAFARIPSAFYEEGSSVKRKREEGRCFLCLTERMKWKERDNEIKPTSTQFQSFIIACRFRS